MNGTVQPDGLRIFLMVAACVLLAWSAGCVAVSEEAVKEAKDTSTEFLIGPEDVLQVVVWRNKDLSGEVVVRPDGMISLPLIGDVRASGLTAQELSGQIEERLRQYVESPTVTVGVKEVQSYTLYVLGEVNNPGKFQLKAYARVLQAIALAGGFTQFASKNSIQVIRYVRNGVVPHEVHIPVRYDDLLTGEGSLGNFILRSGDIVVVP